MLGVGNLTPTQLAAHERSRAFKAKIAEMAARLTTNLETLTIEPVPADPVIEERPREEPKSPWFSIVKEVDLVPRDYPSIAMIQRVVSEYYNITKNDLLSACREWRVAHPRQIAMYLCRDLTPKSLPEIGRRFGKRDHSTVHHAYHKIRNLIATDAAFAAEIGKLKELLA